MGFSLAGMFLVRPLFHKWIHGQDRTNEMVSLNIASFSVFYGILLGLVAVGVYANYAAASDLVEREASTLAALYSDTGALPEPHRTKLLADLRAYAKETIDKDWPTQAKGLVPTGGTDRINVFQRGAPGGAPRRSRSTRSPTPRPPASSRNSSSCEVTGWSR